MAEQNQIYKCTTCNDIIEVLISGKGNFTCCDQAMELLEAKNKDEGQEKHVPMITKTDNGYLVKIGSVPHPMEKEHYIQFIEIIAAEQIYRQNLKPGQVPVAGFCIQAANITAREHCNIHGLWKS